MTTSSGEMSAPGGRRESRERAIELAYEAEVRKWSVDELLESLSVAPDQFVVDLLTWSQDCREESEKRISDKAAGWTLARMPPLDLLVMLMAVAELLKSDTPTGVVLAEATELATRYSTEESGGFVNGVLAAIAKDVR